MMIIPAQQCGASDPLGVHAFCCRQKSLPPIGPLTADVEAVEKPVSSSAT